jgi:poly-gamma-glutamate synthesis protein (capsule biosynthesis protein)
MDKSFYNFKKCFGDCKNFLLVFLVILILSGCRSNTDKAEILFTGDILLSRNVAREISTRQTFPWEKLQKRLQNADLVIGNLEGAVGKTGDAINPKIPAPVFAIDSSHLAFLHEAGFDAVTLENNHSLDLGGKSKKSTIQLLQHDSVTPLYAANSPWFFRVKGFVVSVIAINMVMGRDSSHMQLPSVEVLQQLRLAHSLSNIVVVFVHWGSELLEWPNTDQRRVARWLVKNGADVIIGSHPHVIQPPEIIEGKPVFFSLGNHLFDQKYADTKKGLIASIKIRDGRMWCSGLFTHTRPHSFYPELTGEVGYNLPPVKIREKTLSIKKIRLLPVSTFYHDRPGIILYGIKGNKNLWNTHPLPLVTIEKSKFDGKHEFLFTLEKYYSDIDHRVDLRPHVYRADENGLYARWRGSALAWPIIDARIASNDSRIICVLHRGNSYINPETQRVKTRFTAYKWNGFGFTGLNDSLSRKYCRKLFNEERYLLQGN